MRLELDRDSRYFWSPDDPGEPSTGEPRHSVTTEEAAILAELARGRRVLEIGTGLGVSTRALASTASTVCTVDPDAWVQNNVWPALSKEHVSMSFVSRPPITPSAFDMAFIDGDHSRDAVARDLRSCRRTLRPFAPILLHDYRGAVVEACRRVGFACIKRWWPSSLAVGVLP